MTEPLLTLCLDVVSLALALALGCAAWRIARGPTLLDRILAFDVLTVAATALLVVQSIRWHTTDYMGLILIYTVLGFSTSMAFVAYLSRSDGAQAGERNEAGEEVRDGD